MARGIKLDLEQRVKIFAPIAGSAVKNLPADAGNETTVRFLGWEDTMEEEMATNSSILAWRIPWTEEPDGL